jgi:hypothetical protein
MKWRVAELERLNAQYRQTLETMARARGGRTLGIEDSKRVIEIMNAPVKEPTPEQIRAFETYRTKVADPCGNSFFTPRTEVTKPCAFVWEDDSITPLPDRSTWFHRVIGLLICMGVCIAFWWFIYTMFALSKGSYATYTQGVGK